jgi:hypothetical protein
LTQVIADFPAVGPAGISSTSDSSLSQRAFLRAIWGDTNGYAVVTLGIHPHLAETGRYVHDGLRDHFFRWPEEEEELLQYIATYSESGREAVDVYVAPLLFSKRSRRKEFCLPGRVAWIDADGEWFDGDYAPNIVVASGTPGHFHGYLLLAETTPVATIEALNRGLAVHHAGDMSGWDANQLLRLPGTWNHKQTPPALVASVYAFLEPFPTYYLAPLAKAAPERRQGGWSESRSAVDATTLLDTYRADARTRQLFAYGRTGDRSNDLFALACGCRELDMTREDTFTVLQQSAVNKFAQDGRADEAPRLEGVVEAAFAHTAPRRGIAPQAMPALYQERDGALYAVRWEQVPNRVTGELSWAETGSYPLCNFVARIVRQVLVDHGDGTQTRTFLLECHLPTGRVFSVEIDASSFALSDKLHAFLLEAGGAAINVYPRRNAELRAAIQALSGEVPEERVFAHTGWAILPEGPAYLLPGGSVAPAGLTPMVRLDHNLRRYGLPATTVESDVLAGAAVLLDHLLEVFDHGVTYPAVAHAFLPILRRFLPLGKPYLLHLAGETGSRKTAFACALLGLYGDFADGTPPVSWQSTINAIEGIGHRLQDALLLVDDYKPGTVKPRAVIELIQRYGEGVGRERMAADATLKTTQAIRAVLHSTGEDVPTGEASSLARMLVLRVGRDACRVNYLSAAQEGARHLNALLRAFIEFVIVEEHGAVARAMADVADRRDRIGATLRRAVPGGTNLGRVAMNLALNATAWELLLAFLANLGAIDQTRHAALRAEYEAQLPDLARGVATLVTEEKASALYLGALKGLVAGERAVLRDLDGQFALDGDTPVELRPGQTMLGWRDAEGIYLIPEIAYNAVAAFLRQGGQEFGFTKNAVHEQLHSDGLLVRVGKDSKAIVKRVGKDKKTERVLHLRPDALDETEDVTSDIDDAE